MAKSVAVVRRSPFQRNQQNGRHERMHLTLKKEATKPASANVLQQQARFDAFVDRYNQERPHPALGMKVPADTLEIGSPQWTISATISSVQRERCEFKSGACNRQYRPRFMLLPRDRRTESHLHQAGLGIEQSASRQPNNYIYLIWGPRRIAAPE
jgi:hypothetical protein